MVIKLREYAEPLFKPKAELENWIKGQTTGLYLNNDRCIQALSEAGITDPSDLFGLTEDDIKEIAEELRKPGNDSEGTPLLSFKLSARTICRLKETLEVVNYLSRVRRDITWDAICWDTVQVLSLIHISEPTRPY